MTEQIGTATTSNGIATITYKPTTSGSKSITAVNTATDTISSNTSNSLALTVNQNTYTADCTSLTDWSLYTKNGTPTLTINNGISEAGDGFAFYKGHTTTANCVIEAVINGTGASTTNALEIGLNTSTNTNQNRPCYLRLFTNCTKISKENPSWSDLYTYNNVSISNNSDITVIFTIVNGIVSFSINGTTLSNTITLSNNSDYIIFNNAGGSITMKSLNITFNGGGGVI